MKKLIYKHTPYFEVLESLQKAKKCALCEMKERSNHRYFDSLLYENVNDPALRKKLIRSGGFCSHHARILLEFGDGLGVSIIYQDQLKAILSFLQDIQSLHPASLSKKALSYIKSREQCPACEQEHQNDEHRLQTLLSGLTEAEMRQALEKSPGLCLSHLIKALTLKTEPEIQQYLIAMHKSKYSDLLAELHEFCKKHDYSHSDEKFGKEHDSWRRVVDILTIAQD